MWCGMRRVIGNIPENVVYIYSHRKTLIKTECYWDDPTLHVGWVGQEVVPAFCSDASNEKTRETGRLWAGHSYWDYNTKTQITPEIKEFTRKNDPITIKIVSLEKRNEGGRAYKIITEDGYYFDLREDVLLDTIIECGIDKGGTPKGKFVWARVGSQMKLVRVGSKLHESLIESTNDRVKKPIKNLKIGGIYAGRDKRKFIYLGNFDYTDITLSYPDGGNNNEWVVYGNRYNKKPDIIKTNIKSQMFFYEIDKYGKDDKLFDSLHRFSTKKNHAFINEIEIVALPENWLAQLKEMVLMEGKKDECRYSMYYLWLATLRPANTKYYDLPVEVELIIENWKKQSKGRM